MPLKKEIQKTASRESTTYHRVETVSVDLVRNTANIGLACYADQADHDDEKEPVARVHLMLFAVAPEKGQDILQFAESVLVVDAPADFDAATEAVMPVFGVGRYAFAGAEIVS